MDMQRSRTITLIVLMAAAVCAVAGLFLYTRGSVIPGVLLLIIGVAVGMICITVLRLMSWVDNPWLVNEDGRRKRRSRKIGKEDLKGFRRGPRRVPDVRSQNLLLSLSAGWCFLKQSLQ